MASENEIRNVLSYINGFRGFEAKYVNYATGESKDNIIIRKATYYLRNQVMVIEFNNYTLVIRDALNRTYKQYAPTIIQIVDVYGNMQEIEIVGLAGTMEDFLNSFIPRNRNLNGAFCA